MIVLVSTSSTLNVSTIPSPQEELYGKEIDLRRLIQLLAIALLYASHGSAFIEAF